MQGQTIINPKGEATRTQAATILMNFLQKVEQEYITDNAIRISVTIVLDGVAYVKKAAVRDTEFQENN